MTIRGFDVDNPGHWGVRPGSEDGNRHVDDRHGLRRGVVLFRNVGFLGANPYHRLRQALKAEIDPEAWASLTSATSQLITHPATGKIAIEGGRPYATSS